MSDSFDARFNQVVNGGGKNPAPSPASATSSDFNKRFEQITNPTVNTSTNNNNFLQDIGKSIQDKNTGFWNTVVKGIQDPIKFITDAPILPGGMTLNQSGQFYGNVFDQLSKLTSKGIAKGQEYLAKPENAQVTKALSDVQNTLDLTVGPYSKGFAEQFLGWNKPVMDAFDKVVPKTNNKLLSAYNTVGESAGAAVAFLAGGELVKGLQLGKASLPVLFAALGQTSSPSTTTAIQRLEKLPIDVVAGYLMNFVPATKKFLSVDTLKGAGYVASTFKIQSFLNALTSGMKPEDAAKVSDKMALVGALFHLGGTFIQPQSGQAKLEMTPQELRNRVIGTPLEGTPTGDYLIKSSLDAEAQGKNVIVEGAAVGKSQAAKIVGTKPLEAVGVEQPKKLMFKTTLVDPTTAGTIGTGEKPTEAAPGTQIQPLKTDIVKTGESQANINTSVADIIPQAIINKYTSAADLANAQYSAKPTDQIGTLDPKTIIPRDPVDQKVVDEYVNKIKNNQLVEPIEITKTATGYETVDGSNRLTAYQQAGVQVPVIYRGPDKITGLSTFEDVYNSSTNKPQEVKTEGKVTIPEAIKSQDLYLQNTKDNTIQKIPDNLKEDFWKLDNQGLAKGKDWHITAGLTPDKIKRAGLKDIGVANQATYDELKKTITPTVEQKPKTDLTKLKEAVKKYKSADEFINDARKLAETITGSPTGVIGNGQENMQKALDILKENGYDNLNDFYNKVKNNETKTEIKEPVVDTKQISEDFVAYKRGDLTAKEKELDALIQTDTFNFNGSWKNKLAARVTAMDQLEYYAKEGIAGADEAYKQALQLEDDLKNLRTEKNKQKVPSGIATNNNNQIGNFENGNQNALLEEAKKYKTAEEFVKNNVILDSLLPTDKRLGKTLADEKYLNNKVNIGKTLATPLEIAIENAKKINNVGGDGSVGNYNVQDILNKIKDGRITVYHGTSKIGAEKIGGGWAGLKNSSYLSLSKGSEKEALGVYGAKYYADIANKYGKNGQVLKFEIPINNIAVDKITGELRFVNNKNKSQLTDIWNEAQKPQVRVASGIASSGAEQIGEYEKVPLDKTEAGNFKLFEKIREFTAKYVKMIGKGTLGESYMSRGALGTFYPDTFNVRINGMNDLSVASHEDAHLLDFAYKISDKLLEVSGFREDGKPIYAKSTKGLRKEITDLYTEYYPGGKKTHSLKKRTIEGFATLMQKYTEIPTTITEKYPNLVKEFLKEGGKYYQPVIGEMLSDLKAIVKEYQGLDPLDKIGARVTNESKLPDKPFLNIWEKIRTFIEDEIYPLEKLAVKANVHFTKNDPSLWLRAMQTGGGVYSNNIMSDRGYWGFRNGDFVKVHEFNWKTLIDDLNKNKIHDSFGFYLVARREHFAYEELTKLKEAYDIAKKIVDDLGGPSKATEMVNDKGNSPLADMKAAKEAYDHLNAILTKDGFTKDEVSEAYLQNKDRFTKQEEMFDALTHEDLALFNDPQVQLMKDEMYNQLKDKKGYASFKRQFEDELVGDQPYSGVSNKPGVKASFLKSRTGSARAIIDPVSSGMRNHVEAVKKAMRQIVYNKIGDIADSALVPDMFQKLKLQPSVDAQGRITYPQEKDPNIIMARQGYKRVPVLTDSLIKATVDNIMTFQAMNMFEQLLVSSARVFTVGTTGYYPAFAATNFAADQWNAIVNSKNKYTPLVDQLKILKDAIVNKGGDVGKIYEMYEVLGGSRLTLANFLSLPADEAVKQVINERNGVQKVLDLIDKGTSIFALPSNISETTSRFTEFYKAIKAGKSQVVALEEAARVTGPFHHIGSWRIRGASGKSFIRSMPFANAGLQIVAQVIRTAGESKEGRNRVLFTMLSLAALMLTSMASVALFGTKDQKEQYKDLKPNELGMFLYYPAFNDKGMVRVKVSPELAVIGTLLTMALNQKIYGNKYTFQDYSSAVFNILPQQMQINEPESMFLSWFAPIAKIPFELIAGVKDYPRVMPIESRGMEYKPPGQRFNEGTSTLAKKIGEYTNLSPMKIDFLLTGILGRSTGFATGKPGIYSIQSAFLRDYWFTTGRRIENFYDAKTAVDQKVVQIENVPKGERSTLIKQAGQYARINEFMKDYRKFDLAKPADQIKAKALRDKILFELNKLNIK